MFTIKLLKSAIFLTLLFTLASCYTRFGMARVEPVDEEYGYQGEPAHEEITLVRHASALYVAIASLRPDPDPVE